MQNKSCNSSHWSKPRLKRIVCVVVALETVSAWAAGPRSAETFQAQESTTVGSPLVLAANSAGDDGLGDRDALFGDIDSDPAPILEEKSSSREMSLFKGIRGFVQVEMARAYQEPVHWSKMLTRADISGQGALGNGIKWKLGARFDYDAVHSLYDFYPADVSNDQRFGLTLRENYLDISAGDWDFRLGKQHVVWGEMVGLFFADVVSARDMREFVLPEFDTMRITQWAARAEYFSGDFHSELLWIPVASYDQIGKPGAEFYPNQPQLPGIATSYRNEELPARNLSHMNYGVRLSTLKNGWDLSGFVYSSMDVAPTFYRDTTSLPNTLIYQARHDRINQVGLTMAKDLGSAVLKGEAVYTHGRQFSVLRVTDDNGVVAQNTLDWAVGLDFSLPADTRLNAQLFQRDFFAYDRDLVSDKHESGYSLLLNHKFNNKLEAQVTWISSFNRTDWLLRPRITWDFQRNWRLAVGADIFKGPALGLFGRFDGRDRVYSEMRYSF